LGALPHSPVPENLGALSSRGLPTAKTVELNVLPKSPVSENWGAWSARSNETAHKLPVLGGTPTSADIDATYARFSIKRPIFTRIEIPAESRVADVASTSSEGRTFPLHPHGFFSAHDQFPPMLSANRDDKFPLLWGRSREVTPSTLFKDVNGKV
jgi:hypothetical protein